MSEHLDLDQLDRGFSIRDGVIYTRANQGVEMPSPQDFEICVQWAMNAHTRFALPDKRFRKFDGITPIIVHPLDCMAEIMQEPLLSAGDRVAGGLGLLTHDVFEDTSVKVLPPVFFHPRVSAIAQAMTFPGGTAEEMEKIWDAEPFVILCKLYDKFSNWKAMGYASTEKRLNYANYIRKLLKVVKEAYGDQLHVVKLAEALLV